MILKDYQQTALNDLEDFLQILDAEKSLPTAYKIFWENRDVPAKSPYQNNISGVPQICFKVPTGGEKIILPQFFYRGESNLFETQSDVKISKEMLCKNFLKILSQKSRKNTLQQRLVCRGMNFIYSGKIFPCQTKNFA